MKLKSKIVEFAKYIFDKKKIVTYEIIKDAASQNLTWGNCVVLNDFVGYPRIRSKKLGVYTYLCSRLDAIEVLRGFEGLRVVVLTSDKNNSKDEINDVLKAYGSVCEIIILTNNVGGDIGAYIAGAHYLNAKSIDIASINLMNTSQFYRAELINGFLACRANDLSIMGVSYGIGPRFSLLKDTHVQTFLIKSPFKLFQAFVRNVCPQNYIYTSKYSLIKIYEVGFSKFAKIHGYSMLLWQPDNISKIYPKISLFHFDYRFLIFRNNITANNAINKDKS